MVCPPPKVTTFFVVSIDLATSLTTVTPWLRDRPVYGVVMSAIFWLPPITRLEIGQDTKALFGSTSTTSIL